MANKTFTYTGGCDTLREARTFQWRTFKTGELVEGRSYEILSTWLAQWSWIMKEGKFVRDESGERYQYHQIENESGVPVYVWEGFSKENTNL
jgi:hypothetical protein